MTHTIKPEYVHAYVRSFLPVFIVGVVIFVTVQNQGASNKEAIEEESRINVEQEKYLHRLDITMAEVKVVMSNIEKTLKEIKNDARQNR